jgi:hypothetical protein
MAAALPARQTAHGYVYASYALGSGKHERSRLMPIMPTFNPATAPYTATPRRTLVRSQDANE